MLLSKRLKTLRIQNDLTQRKLGELVNVTKVSICCYENGTRTPTLDTLTKLAEIFNVELDYLMGYDEKVNKKGKKQKTTRVAKEEIEFIKELRKYENLYNEIIKNPKKMVEIILKKI